MNSLWSFFKPLQAPAQRRFTLEELRELYAVLVRNPVVNESNRALVVETIRSIAEFMIWGDQNEPRIFDFFLENNIMTYLQRVLQQPANRSGEVAKQVLQTLSIIIQNVRSETAVFFLFSNNHVNDIVDLDFDFDDEEVLGYYISFLKTISLKLNRGTAQFFINTGSGCRGFPLYTRAIRLAHNREGMVRAAVRTLTLHVYSVGDPDIQAFVSSAPASNYFSEVTMYLAEQIQLLDRRLCGAEAGGSQALGSLDSQLAEVEDVLSYVSDLLSLGVNSIAQLLASSLWNIVVYPQLLKPLMEPGAAMIAAAAAVAAAVPVAGGRHSRKGSGSSTGALTPPGAGGGGLLGSPAAAFRSGAPWAGSGSSSPLRDRQQDAGPLPALQRVRPVCAVFVLERLFQLVMYPPLLQQLLLALTCGGGSTSSAGSSDAGVASVSCRSTLLSILTGGQPYPAVMVLRLLVAVLLNRHIATELLSALTMLPRKRQQQLGLSAVGSSDTATALHLEALVQVVLSQLQQVSLPSAADRSSNEGDICLLPLQQQQQPGLQCLRQASSGSINMLNLLTQQYLPNQLQDLVKRQSQPDAACAAANGPAAAASTTSSSTHHRSRSIEDLESWLVQAEGQVEDSVSLRRRSSSFCSSAFSAMGPQLLSALLHLLQLPALPPMGLWLVGWLLHQLLPTQSSTAAVAGTSSCSQQGVTPCSVTPPASIAPVTAGTGDSSSSSSDVGIDSSNSSDLDDDDDGDSRQIGASRASSVSCAAASTEGSVDASDAWALRPPVSFTATSSYAALDQAASVLSSDQQQLVQAALAAAQHALSAHLVGMWCEAVFPMVTMEWQTAREQIQRPVLRAGSDALLTGTAVWPLLAGLQQQQQQGLGLGLASTAAGSAAGSKTAWDALSVSARAGLECYMAVQRVVALTQLQELLSCGGVSLSPPVPTVSEADLKQVDVQEGYQVDLAPGSALPCVVSFAPGQERRVFFAVAGLSRRQVAALQGSNAAAAPPPDHASRGSLLCSLPVAVLADPSPTRPAAGIVLSVAPLLGAHPYTDQGVAKWLHVHVRPSVRGLLRVIKTAAAKKGGLLSAMRQLADGHWVLAFSAADKAAGAVHLVQQHTARLQALYQDALAPLCGAEQQQAAQQQQQEEQQKEKRLQEEQQQQTRLQEEQRDGEQQKEAQQQEGQQDTIGSEQQQQHQHILQQQTSALQEQQLPNELEQPSPPEQQQQCDRRSGELQGQQQQQQQQQQSQGAAVDTQLGAQDGQQQQDQGMAVGSKCAERR